MRGERLRLSLLVAGGLVLLALNAYVITLTDWTMLRGGAGADWTIFVEASRRVHGGDLYAVESDYAFRYSPLLAYAFGAIGLLGPWIWRALHVLVLGLLPSRWMALAVLLSWPFWFDVEAGNLLTFVFVAAALAIERRGWGSGAFLVLAVLVPRPLMLPVAVWILWKQPAWRWPFVAMVVVHAALVLATGWGPAWIAALANSTAEVDSALNFGPSALIGLAWAPVGLALAALLTWRGRLGWASLAASPYWLPYYLLMPLLELRRRGPAEP